MKQSVENTIKKAFDAWDEQSSDIGFNKDTLWQSIHPTPQKSPAIFSWTRIAAAAIVLFLAGGWLNAMYTNHQLKKEKLAITQQLDQSKAIHIKDTPSTVLPPAPAKIVYKTKIKKVESPQTQTMLADLAKKYQSVENTNELLKQQMAETTSSNSVLNDSIQKLLVTLHEIEKAYALQAQANQPAKENELEIKIDEAALLALSESQAPQQRVAKETPQKFQITLKNRMTKTESSAPFFKEVR
ncbi:MAG: hypothetical protein JEZ14_16360 [Marinilabiliaceae bacterium]|nr:hypothetical protein [Marinilabiliaceae bacterium]